MGGMFWRRWGHSSLLMGPLFLLSNCVALHLFHALWFHEGFFLAALWVSIAMLMLSWVGTSCGEWGQLSSAAHRLLLIVVTSVAEHRLYLGPLGSVVVVPGLSCPAACGMFLDQESNLCPHFSRQILNPWTTREVPMKHFYRRTVFHG